MLAQSDDKAVSQQKIIAVRHIIWLVFAQRQALRVNLLDDFFVVFGVNLVQSVSENAYGAGHCAYVSVYMRHRLPRKRQLVLKGLQAPKHKF